MLLINAVFLVDKLKPFIPTALLVGAWVPVSSVSLCLQTASFVVPKRVYVWLNDRLYEV